MIRAFAVALGIGTIRLWVGLVQLVGLLAIQDNAGTGWFGVAHAVAAEAYLLGSPGSVGPEGHGLARGADAVTDREHP